LLSTADGLARAGSADCGCRWNDVLSRRRPLAAPAGTSTQTAPDLTSSAGFFWLDRILPRAPNRLAACRHARPSRQRASLRFSLVPRRFRRGFKGTVSDVDPFHGRKGQPKASIDCAGRAYSDGYSFLSTGQPIIRLANTSRALPAELKHSRVVGAFGCPLSWREVPRSAAIRAKP
jgi:hypothetical protein